MGASRRKYNSKGKCSLGKKNNSQDVVLEKGKWICIDVAERYRRTIEFKNALSAIKIIFGNDCIHLLVIGHKLDNELYHNEMGGYVFVKCRNIDDYVKILKQSKFIASILSSYDDVSYISQNEIRLMVADYRSKSRNTKKEQEIYYGDIVNVKSGKYQNLTGIVCDKINDKYLVFFKFNFGNIKEKLLYSNMVKKQNMLDTVKYPMSSFKQKN